MTKITLICIRDALSELFWSIIFNLTKHWNRPARRILNLPHQRLNMHLQETVYILRSCYTQPYSIGVFSCRLNLISCGMTSREFIKIKQVSLKEGCLHLHFFRTIFVPSQVAPSSLIWLGNQPSYNALSWLCVYVIKRYDITGAPEDLMFILHESFLWTTSGLVQWTECPRAVQAHHMSSGSTDVLQIQKKPILPFLRLLCGANQTAVSGNNQKIHFRRPNVLM